MSPRAATISFLGLAAAGIAALIIVASAAHRSDAFSLDVPASAAVAAVPPGVTACQGPISVLVAFRGVQGQVAPVGPAALRLTVRDTSGRPLAEGVVHTAPELAGATTWQLDRTVAAGHRVTLCVQDLGPRPVNLFGGASFPSAGSLRVGSAPTAGVASFAFLRAGARSLLSLVPAMFSRAALFKASWVGSWTFWVLSIAALAAFALAGWALFQALTDAQRSSASTTRQ